ncbi:MAG TPA: glycoside hydrolase family 5 protein [Vicinamibacteria bacterium]|nr:glycoside hydrolase family 5 protein [Vicinamibacteria bacterium]
MPRLDLAVALAGLLLADPALAQAPATAPPPANRPTSYRNFDLAIYCRVDDVRRMAEGDWLERHFDLLARQLRIGKVYLETHRSGVMNDRETMLKVKRFFEEHGVRTAGGITLVADEGREFRQYSYTDPADRKHVAEVVRFTASLFDELILDDFFFTTTKRESDIKAKGARSWSEFRLGLMREAAQSLVVGPAKAANPKIKVVIKYPNWYEHFPYAGFDLENEPRIFDGIYTGTETRDATYTAQHLQEYQSYSIQRYFENVKPGGNGGGWVDPFLRGTLDRYSEQLELTLLARAREITLFCFSDLFEDVREADGTTRPASRVAGVAADTFERVDAILSQLGNPVGVSAYKPYHSSGEDFLHSFLGMVGIPVELTPQFREDLPLVLLNASAAKDPAIVERIEKQLRSGRSVVITTGLLRALQGRGIEQIVDLEVSDRKLLTRRFSRFGGVFEGSKDILLPQLRYATNDSWEEIGALDGENGFPLLHHADYGSGRLFTLAVPDNFADLYELPAPVLDHIRAVVTKGLPVRLSGPSRVALFAYDNGSFVVHSFLPQAVAVDVIVGERGATLVELGSVPRMPRGVGPELPGQPRPDGTAFTVFLQPHVSRAFRTQAAVRASSTSAHAFAVNQRLGRGVNIIGYDPIWQDRAKARFQEKHFQAIHDAGFGSVRINLHPFKAMDPANGHAIAPAWLSTLDWAVKGALAAHLAVILDLHEFHAMAEDPVGRKEMLLSFWRQIAPRFKDAPDEVVFELLNEPFGKLTPEMWNGYLKEALAVVRASNPTRVVVVGPGQWNGISALPGLVLPEEDRNLIVTVHYYAPMEFTHQGAAWAPEYADKTGVPWVGTDQERRRTELDLARAQEWAAARDRPVLLGEFGAYDNADMDSRARYTAHVARTAERLGWSWAYWQFDSDFVVYDVPGDRWVEPLRRALVP